LATVTVGDVRYQGSQEAVHWEGIVLAQDTNFDSFLSESVASRLADAEGQQTFERDLKGLGLTGFGRDTLDAVLAARSTEERDWAAGEALAEAWLTSKHQVVWPWNMERDKRNPLASLPGADLVGFVPINDGFRLVLGEVKSSGERNHPPQVMQGRSGMIHQIDILAGNLQVIGQLLKWLHARCQSETFREMFAMATVAYFNSGLKAVHLFGVLIRDTEPKEADLKARGEALARRVAKPTQGRLIALYLPISIGTLPQRVLARKTA